ncbi:MAG: hypothetical protein U1A78_18730 [Polyangia bacterium]
MSSGVSSGVLGVSRASRAWGSRLLAAALLLGASGLSGCAHTRTGQSLGTQGAVTTIEMEPLQIELGKSGTGDGMEVFDAPTLFEEAGQLFDADKFADAAARYDRLASSFPESGYAAPALFNAGLSYEALARFGDAAERYQKLTRGYAGSKHAKESQLRLGACFAELGRWVQSSEVLGEGLRRPDLTLDERVETQARLGLAHFELSDLAVAEQHFNGAVGYYTEHKDQERLESPFFLAMAHFYSAHITHRRFRELPIRSQKALLSQDIDAKAKMFLLAHQRYVDTIKVKNPSWATASGYHLGALYRELYDSLVNAPLPPELKGSEQRALYDLLVRDQLRGLLEKSQGILEKNIEMAERVGVKNGWVTRSTEQLAELRRLIDGLDGPPTQPTAAPRPVEPAPEVPSRTRPRPKAAQPTATPAPTPEPAT